MLPAAPLASASAPDSREVLHPGVEGTWDVELPLGLVVDGMAVVELVDSPGPGPIVDAGDNVVVVPVAAGA